MSNPYIGVYDRLIDMDSYEEASLELLKAHPSVKTSKHILKLRVDTDLHFSIAIATSELDDIAKQMVGQCIYDGEGDSVANIIGKITSAKVEDNADITYEAEVVEP